MPQTNPKRRFIALNNNAGAFTVIRLTTWAKYVEIAEDPAYNAGVGQGLQGNYLDPFAVSPNMEAGRSPANEGGAVFIADVSLPGALQPPLTFGDKHNIHSGTEMPLGNPGSAGHGEHPGGGATVGTPIVQLRSNTATATGIIVSEYA